MKSNEELATVPCCDRHTDTWRIRRFRDGTTTHEDEGVEIDLLPSLQPPFPQEIGNNYSPAVEEERIHVRSVRLHGVQCKPHQPQPELEAPLYARGQQVEREDGYGKDPEQREPIVEPQEVVVQEGRHGGLDHHVDDHVSDPDGGNDGRHHAHEEPHDGLQRIKSGRESSQERRRRGRGRE